MNPNEKSSKKEERERIDLNDYNRKEEDSARKHSDQSIKMLHVI